MSAALPGRRPAWAPLQAQGNALGAHHDGVRDCGLDKPAGAAASTRAHAHTSGRVPGSFKSLPRCLACKHRLKIWNFSDLGLISRTMAALGHGGARPQLVAIPLPAF